jgi:hypothetical protein
MARLQSGAGEDRSLDPSPGGGVPKNLFITNNGSAPGPEYSTVWDAGAFQYGNPFTVDANGNLSWRVPEGFLDTTGPRGAGIPTRGDGGGGGSSDGGGSGASVPVSGPARAVADTARTGSDLTNLFAQLGGGLLSGLGQIFGQQKRQSFSGTAADPVQALSGVQRRISDFAEPMGQRATNGVTRNDGSAATPTSQDYEHLKATLRSMGVHL